MISIKKLCPRVNSVWWALAGTATLATLAVVFRFAWNQPTAVACVLYAGAAALFLVAQIFGFVISQTYYSESIEEAKFRMLENEEAEWES